jgi:hypothetical protein
MAILVLLAPPTRAQAPRLEDLLARVVTYVHDTIPRLANIVATETYEQRVRTRGTAANGLSWRLKAELLLVRDPASASDWIMFRDVSEVNGKVVHHEPDRLINLFAAPGPDATARAAAIAQESARFHLPGGSQAVTNPLLVFALMQPRYQRRLRFTLGGEDRSVGPGVRVLRFEEPELVVPGWEPMLASLGRARGSVWIEPSTGRILKTEARMGDGANASTTATTFTRNERLEAMVPAEMRTMWEYRNKEIGPTLQQVQGVATYGNLRRFGVQTESAIVPQP